MLTLLENGPKIDPNMLFKVSLSQQNHANGSKNALEIFKIFLRSSKERNHHMPRALGGAEKHYRDAKTHEK